MATVAVPSIATVALDTSDKLVGVQDGAVKLFDVEDFALSGGRWFGKSIKHFGDSLTEGGSFGTYVTELASILGSNSTNHGSSGSATDRLFGHMTEWDARGGLPVTDIDPDYTTTDAVTIMIGSNGGTTGTTADIIAESVYDLPYNVGGTDYTTAEEHFHRYGNTIYGNVAACVEYVRWKNPSTMIFLCTPPWYTADDGSRDFRAIFQHIADTYCIRMLDVRNEAGLYRRAINQFTYDDQHLNALGNELVAKYIAYRMLHS
jgi:lysophospholipase L1-like esterase